MITRKVFVEPEIMKYEQSLDKVTLTVGCYGTSNSSEKDQED